MFIPMYRQWAGNGRRTRIRQWPKDGDYSVAIKLIGIYYVHTVMEILPLDPNQHRDYNEAIKERSLLVTYVPRGDSLGGASWGTYMYIRRFGFDKNVEYLWGSYKNGE